MAINLSWRSLRTFSRNIFIIKSYQTSRQGKQVASYIEYNSIAHNVIICEYGNSLFMFVGVNVVTVNIVSNRSGTTCLRVYEDT